MGHRSSPSSGQNIGASTNAEETFRRGKTGGSGLSVFRLPPHPTEPSAENGPLETSISLGDLHRKTIKFKCLVQCKQILAVRDGRVLVAHADPIFGGQLSRFKCSGKDQLTSD